MNEQKDQRGWQNSQKTASVSSFLQRPKSTSKPVSGRCHISRLPIQCSFHNATSPAPQKGTHILAGSQSESESGPLKHMPYEASTKTYWGWNEETIRHLLRTSQMSWGGTVSHWVMGCPISRISGQALVLWRQSDSAGFLPHRNLQPNNYDNGSSSNTLLTCASTVPRAFLSINLLCMY